MTTNVPFFDPLTFPSLANLSKAAVGFDSMVKRLNEVVSALPKIQSNYPPYNIRKVDENKYVIEIAVAGFNKQDLEIEMQEGVLTIRGQANVNIGGSSDDRLYRGSSDDYLYRGIADRAFTRTFSIADHVEVKNADLFNGLLKIWLERFIPEEKKPTKIDIQDESTKTTPSSLLTE